MQVYKTFFKIIFKNRMQISIYLLVFIILTLIFTVSYNSPVSTDFSESKINMALINEDTDSVFLDGFISYLTENANLVNLPDDPQSLQDALFFQEVDYILRIPAGFSQNFLEGQTVSLQKTAAPNTTAATFMDMHINQYLNTAKTYIQYDSGISDQALVASLANDLSQNAPVTMTSNTNESAGAEKVGYFFNFMAYTLFAIMILGVCSVMLVFNQSDIKKRNFSSPLRTFNYNSQLILGSLSFAFFAWLLMVAVSFVFNGAFMLTDRGGLLILNSLVFTLTALSISFLISNLVKNQGAMSAVANVFCPGNVLYRRGLCRTVFTG